MVILENIDIDIDIDKAILQNIDIDKISNRFKFGISNRATPPARPALAAVVASVSVCFSSLCLLWHQFWSALTAPEWRLAEQTADRAYKRVTVRE